MQRPLDYASFSRPAPGGDAGLGAFLIGVSAPSAIVVAVIFANTFCGMGTGELRGLLGGLLVLAAGLAAMLSCPFGIWLAYADRIRRNQLRGITRAGYWLNLLTVCWIVGSVVYHVVH